MKTKMLVTELRKAVVDLRARGRDREAAQLEADVEVLGPEPCPRRLGEVYRGFLAGLSA